MACVVQLVGPFIAFEIMLAVWDDGGMNVRNWLAFVSPLLLVLVGAPACVLARAPHAQYNARGYRRCSRS